MWVYCNKVSINPNSQESEIGGSEVQGQLGLHSGLCLKKEKKISKLRCLIVIKGVRQHRSANRFKSIVLTEFMTGSSQNWPSELCPPNFAIIKNIAWIFWMKFFINIFHHGPLSKGHRLLESLRVWGSENIKFWIMKHKYASGFNSHWRYSLKWI